MLKRFGTHLRGNVVGYVALFVVLGGSAYALPGRNVIDRNDLKKGVVKTKNLKANAATGAKVNEGTLDFTCPTGKIEAVGYCWDPTLTTPDSWESAFTDCIDKGGAMPSLAQLASAGDKLGISPTEDVWAGQVYEDGADRAVAINMGSLLPLQQPASNSHSTVCLYPLVD